MVSGPITSWQIDGEKVEALTDYFLGLQNLYISLIRIYLLVSQLAWEKNNYWVDTSKMLAEGFVYKFY